MTVSLLVFSLKRFYHKIPNIFQGKTRSESELMEELQDKKLEKAVKRQMIADVPIGAMLSGGLDSSTLTSNNGK